MRNYKKERENYHSRPEQMVRNAARKRARRQMEKEGKAKPGDGKDVHHKDNDPLNNDKKNLSLVTQHYNRKEPRIREKKLKLQQAFKKGKNIKEDAAAAADLKAKQAAEAEALKTKQEGEIEALKAKHEREGERQKKQDEAEVEAEKARDAREDVQEANAISMSNPNAKRMIGLMQKYFNTKDKDKKAALLKDINKYQKMFGLKVSEDMGTVTGPHIAGTGDDSSTVVVKKKKKKVYRRESLKKRVLDNVLAIQQKV